MNKPQNINANDKARESLPISYLAANTNRLGSFFLYDLNKLFFKKSANEQSATIPINADQYKDISIISAVKEGTRALKADPLYPKTARNKLLLTAADVIYQTIPVFLIAPLASALSNGHRMSTIISLAIGLALCWTIRSWANRNRDIIDETFFRRAWRTSENSFLQKHMQRSLISQQDLGYNDKLTKVKEQGNRLSSFIQRSYEIGGHFAAATLATLGIVYQLPYAGIAILATSGLYLANHYRYAQDFNNTEDQVAETRRGYWYKRTHITTPLHVRDLKLFGQEQNSIERVDSADNELARPRLVDTTRLVKRNTLPSYLSLAINFSILAYTGIQTYFGALSSEVFMQIISLALYAEFQLGLTTKAFSMLLQDYTVVREALAIDKQGDPEVVPGKQYKDININRAPNINFKNVGFTSKTGDVILQNINLKLEPGKVYGFCGKSGAGKTTLIKLLTGELEPTQGEITLNGININDIHPFDRKQLFRYMPQDYATFESLSIADSIRLGAHPSQNGQALENALKLAQIDFVKGDVENVVAAPEGQFSNSQPLSLGERQRVAIARTTIAQSPVLIMDEPGSSLDHENEDTILNTVIEQTRHQESPRLFLLISHRFANLKKADCIFFFTRGAGITEQGTHKELMQNKSNYARLAGLEDHIDELRQE